MREVAVEEDGGDDGRIGSGIDFGFGSRRLGHELGPTECHRVGPEPGIVTVVDPHVESDDHPSLQRDVELLREFDRRLLSAADVVAILTDHENFDLAAVAASPAQVLDTRGCLPPGTPGVRRL